MNKSEIILDERDFLNNLLFEYQNIEDNPDKLNELMNKIQDRLKKNKEGKER